jgi:hypothetical protein
MNVIDSELMEIKSEKKMKIISTSAKINQSVPETCRILQENEQIKEKKSNSNVGLPVSETRTIVHDAQHSNHPTDTTNNIKEQIQKLKTKEMESTVVGQELRNTIENNETDLEQTIDTRLLLNNKNHTTAEDFTTMIREYNTYGNSTINEIGAYIINRAECRYKTKRAYQNAVRAERTKMNFQITSADLTPAYTPAASLATADVPDHSINAVRLQTNTKRKTVNVKF